MKKKKKNDKYSPTKKVKRDSNKLSSMINGNTRYLSVPHGAAK